MANERNNIYVGNRYVPIFANPVEWDNLRSYEPLTIVTYQGTSYTSKKQVPVGTALNNTEYWVVTGNYNEQVEHYRQEVEEVINDVNELDEKVTIRTNEHRKYIFIGSSYNMEMYSGGWASFVKSALGLTEGTDAWTSAQSGGGFIRYGSYQTQLATITNGLTQKQKEEMTDIVFVGDINDGLDVHSPSEVSTAISEIESYISSNYPNAKTWILLGEWAFSNDTIRVNASRIYQLIHYYAKNSIVKNCFTNFLIPTLLNTDMVHPTSSGQELLAKNIVNILNSGDEFISNGYPRYAKVYDVQTGTSGIAIEGTLSDNGWHIKYDKFDKLAFSTPVNIPAASATGNGERIANIFRQDNDIFERDAEFYAYCQYKQHDNTVGFAMLHFKVMKNVPGTAVSDNWSIYVKNCHHTVALPNVTEIYPHINTDIDFWRS